MKNVEIFSSQLRVIEVMKVPLYKFQHSEWISSIVRNFERSFLTQIQDENFISYIRNGLVSKIQDIKVEKKILFFFKF